jgi:hypothetical protein
MESDSKPAQTADAESPPKRPAVSEITECASSLPKNLNTLLAARDQFDRIRSFISCEASQEVSKHSNETEVGSALKDINSTIVLLAQKIKAFETTVTYFTSERLSVPNAYKGGNLLSLSEEELHLATKQPPLSSQDYGDYVLSSIMSAGCVKPTPDEERRHGGNTFFWKVIYLIKRMIDSGCNHVQVLRALVRLFSQVRTINDGLPLRLTHMLTVFSIILGTPESEEINIITSNAGSTSISLPLLWFRAPCNTLGARTTEVGRSPIPTLNRL